MTLLSVPFTGQPQSISLQALGQRHEQLLHLGVVGCSQTSSRIPSWNGSKSIGVTSCIGTVGDIVQHLGVSIEHGVHETNSALASCEALLIDLDSFALV